MPMERPSNAVLISESITLSKQDITVFNTKVDMTERRHTEEVYEALDGLFDRVCLYSTLEDFLYNIHKHLDDLVFPNWMGELSRNRAALIPAICESAGIKYVGGDAYTRLICGDKNLAKALVRETALNTPDWLICRDTSDIELLPALELPCVVKPNQLNSSIGISQKNLVRTYRDAEVMIRYLWEEIGQPVIVETFCPGQEIAVAMIGPEEGRPEIAATERFVEGRPDFFDHNLFDVYIKKRRDIETQVRPAPHLSGGDERELSNLFRRLGKVNMIRIDCKLDEGCLSIIELSPNPLMAATSDFMGAFMMTGLSYRQVVERIVDYSIQKG